MGTQITLTIPDHVYQQAKQIAQANQRPLADVINEVLVDAFPSVHISPDRPQMEQELQAFRAMYARLLDAYKDNYVAIHQGQVVDHDKERVALVARIDEAYPNEVVLIKYVTAEPDRVIHVRSPRFIR